MLLSKRDESFSEDDITNGNNVDYRIVDDNDTRCSQIAGYIKCENFKL